MIKPKFKVGEKVHIVGLYQKKQTSKILKIEPHYTYKVTDPCDTEESDESELRPLTKKGMRP